MLQEKKFNQNFRGAAVPAELSQLLKFQNEQANGQYYAAGFELTADDQALLATYSQAPDFLAAFSLFANADGTGSVYGLWAPDAATDLSQAPVVVFGSEGGYHVVAADLRELLHILRYDVEPLVDWEEVSYYKDPDDFEPSAASREFRRWLADNFQITRSVKADKIVAAAQARHQLQFSDWMSQYYSA